MAEEEKESGRGFKVEDRRRFSPETGEPREAEKEASPKASSQAEKATVTQEKEARSESDSLPEITFSSFILGLSTQALMYLGEIPNPQDRQVHRDLAAAQQMIDVLGMLKEKTRGNLDRDEDRLLDHILFDLRMKYVEVVRKK